MKKTKANEFFRKEVAPDRSGTLCIISNGPNLNMDHVAAALASGMEVWVVSDAYRLAPNAALLYASDAPWWDYHINAVVESFAGEKITQEIGTAAKYRSKGLRLMEHAGATKTVVDGKVSGSSSGHHILSIAAQRSFARIILLGFEYGGTSHWFGAHPPAVQSPTSWGYMLRDMPPLAYSIAERGIEVINCTEPTALTCFQVSEFEKELELFKRGREETRPTSRQDAE